MRKTKEQIFPGGIAVKAIFAPEYKWRLIEEFGPCCFTNLLDPKEICAEIWDTIERMRKNYMEGENNGI